ncbi:MAG: DUF4349 domain-containing protein [Bacteroidota bacterium]
MKTYLLLPLLIVAGLCSCKSYKSYSGASDGISYDQVVRAESDLAVASPQVERKIVKNATMRLIVSDVDTVRTQVSALAQTYGGYVQRGDLNQITLRIESQYLDAAMAKVESMGKVDSRSIRSQDVTEQYYDLDSRINSLEKTRDRYLALLEQAEGVGDILAVEKELERVTQELEALQGRYKLLADQVAYSTLTVYLQEKIKPGPIGYIGVGLYEVVKWLFVRN